MRLIDADEYARDMKVRQDAALKWCDDAKTRCDYADYALAETAFSIFCEAKLTLDKQPTIDAVPVVRCKDCKHFVISEGVCSLLSNNYEPPVYCGDEDFCSLGRRKERKGGDE